MEAPSARAQQFEAISRIYALTANITSVFALFIGMFIIYNTFADRGDAAALGDRNSAGAGRDAAADPHAVPGRKRGGGTGRIGAWACWSASRWRAAMAGYIGSLLGDIYGIAQNADEISTNPMLMAVAVVMGVITSVVAAVIPARSAARVDPVKALQKGRYQQLSEGENRVRRIAALISRDLGGGAVYSWSDIESFFYVGDALAVLAAVLLTPTFALWLARALRPLLALAAAGGRNARGR